MAITSNNFKEIAYFNSQILGFPSKPLCNFLVIHLVCAGLAIVRSAINMGKTTRTRLWPMKDAERAVQKMLGRKFVVATGMRHIG